METSGGEGKESLTNGEGRPAGFPTAPEATAAACIGLRFSKSLGGAGRVKMEAGHQHHPGPSPLIEQRRSARSAERLLRVSGGGNDDCAGVPTTLEPLLFAASALRAGLHKSSTLPYMWPAGPSRGSTGSFPHTFAFARWSGSRRAGNRARMFGRRAGFGSTHCARRAPGPAVLSPPASGA